MDAFFVSFGTSMKASPFSYRRRKLTRLLREHSIRLQWVQVGKATKPVITRLVMEAKGAPVVALDERHPLPNDASWLADLTAETIDLTDLRRPQLVYVTCNTDAIGKAQMLGHPILRDYIDRDDGTRWVDSVAESVGELAAQLRSTTTNPAPTILGVPSDIVGVSPCFCQAAEDLDRLIQSPYGLVTGEQGVGKLSLIRAMWRQHRGNTRLIVVPCGSFFKDYYISGSRRRFGGGREAVDQLTPYIMESKKGLLVLHHVEQLPTALQQELDVRLATASDNPDGSMRFAGIDSQGPVDYDLNLVATSTFEPDLLEQSGHVIPDLMSKLRRRHVRIPSLAERGPEDIGLLCDDMLQRISARQRLTTTAKLGKSAFKIMTATNWPTNLSDLLRVLEHAVRRSRGKTIRPDHLPQSLRTTGTRNGMKTLDEVVAQAQRTAIENALRQTGGNMANAAAILGCHKGTLHRLTKKLGIKHR
ncbi:MAG: sigma 54-interacting transcriptional regulator [Planctomycetes bacterium]|nr:sigma 54-interacting transcriptional regulator [Planctomycetota bacterium]